MVQTLDIIEGRRASRCIEWNRCHAEFFGGSSLTPCGDFGRNEQLVAGIRSDLFQHRLQRHSSIGSPSGRPRRTFGEQPSRPRNRIRPGDDAALLPSRPPIGDGYPSGWGDALRSRLWAGGSARWRNEASGSLVVCVLFLLRARNVGERIAGRVGPYHLRCLPGALRRHRLSQLQCVCADRLPAGRRSTQQTKRCERWGSWRK
jgi:hypothetical protein